jgi:hypothetical protein
MGEGDDLAEMAHLIRGSVARLACRMHAERAEHAMGLARLSILGRLQRIEVMRQAPWLPPISG